MKLIKKEPAIVSETVEHQIKVLQLLEKKAICGQTI